MPTQTLSTEYAGRRGGLFRLAFQSSLLTVLTLGFYRFWMKTRLRRYYWSAIRPGGVPLEYCGTGTEKMMGFMVAVVVMAFYIGVVNLILVFVSYALIGSNSLSVLCFFVGVVPIFFYARYRARRYVIARTRWRGVRLGIDQAAWGYAWRAMVHWLITIVTLGFLYPRQRFWLEKYLTDRTWFGRARLRQEGRWTLLLPAAIHFHIGLGITLAAFIGWQFIPALGVALFVGLPWLACGLVHFRVRSFGLLAAKKVLGERVTFTAAPRTGRVLGIYVLGYLLTFATLLMTAFVFIVSWTLLADPESLDRLMIGGFGELLQSENRSGLFLLALGLLFYFSFFILYGVFVQVFVTLPVIRHYAQSVVIGNAHLLAAVPQRSRDEAAEAEGFADALDIGAAI